MATVNITWEDPNNNEDGVRIYRGTAPLDLDNLPVPLADNLPADTTTYSDTTAAAATTYYYVVACFKGDFENPAENVQITTA